MNWDSYEDMMPLWGMPTDGPLQQLWFWSSRWRGWAAPSAIAAPWVATALPAINTPPAIEVLALWTVRGRFPGNFTLWGTWGQIRNSPGRLPSRRKDGNWFLPMDAPGNSTLKGHCSRTDPITSPTRWRQWVTFPEERAPFPGENPECNAALDMAYQLPPPMWWTEEALHKMANLVTTKGRGWDHSGWGGCGSQIFPAPEIPPPATPEWWRTLPGRYWGGKQPAANVKITYTTITIQRSRVLPCTPQSG